MTKTSNEVPAVGAGEHWKAQPIFQLAAVIVKAELVQSPDDWVGPKRTSVAAAVVVVVEPAAVVGDVVDPVEAEVVVVDPDEDVVVVEPPLPDDVVVVLDDPAGGGGVYPPLAFGEPDAAPPPDL